MVGTNFTMANSGTYNSSGVNIYNGTVDVSGQPSGTQLVLKVTSALNKNLYTINFANQSSGVKDFTPGSVLTPFDGQPVKTED